MIQIIRNCTIYIISSKLYGKVAVISKLASRNRK